MEFVKRIGEGSYSREVRELFPDMVRLVERGKKAKMLDEVMREME